MPPPATPPTFADRLRDTRLLRGMTQEQLAAESGVPIPPISRMENGKQMPRVPTVEKLARALRVEPVWLLFGMGPRDSSRPRRVTKGKGPKGDKAGSGTP